mmetsp:Transcript_17280/g.51940  ORF Transcript_17280/g.51940 Transcript_17280/m.51940 type:complete len:290 (+) Transcript_17280:1123-1992(+)
MRGRGTIPPSLFEGRVPLMVTGARARRPRASMRPPALQHSPHGRGCGPRHCCEAPAPGRHAGSATARRPRATSPPPPAPVTAASRSRLAEARPTLACPRGTCHSRGPALRRPPQSWPACCSPLAPCCCTPTTAPQTAAAPGAQHRRRTAAALAACIAAAAAPAAAAAATHARRARHRPRLAPRRRRRRRPSAAPHQRAAAATPRAPATCPSCHRRRRRAAGRSRRSLTHPRGPCLCTRLAASMQSTLRPMRQPPQKGSTRTAHCTAVRSTPKTRCGCGRACPAAASHRR